MDNAIVQATWPTRCETESKRYYKARRVRKIRNKELASFSLRLAAMLQAGLPLAQCLDALAEQTEMNDFRRVLTHIRQRIEAGDTFKEALMKHEYLFGELFISMVEAGETGGTLAEVMAQLGRHLEAAAALRRRVISAMTYPVVVLIMSIVLTSGMIIFIVPQFAEMYADFDATLPLPTQILMEISTVIRENILLVLIGLSVFVCLLRWLKRTRPGRYIWDRYLLQTPVAGKLITKIALARMSRTFASLTRSGVSILRTFDIVSSTIGNRYLSQALMRSRNEVESGSEIAGSLKKREVFPPMMLHMVSVGEKTGNLDGMLEKVADFYEDEIKNTLESLSSLIEPLMMLLLGIIIGGIVICMFLPIFRLSEIVNV